MVAYANICMQNVCANDTQKQMPMISEYHHIQSYSMHREGVYLFSEMVRYLAMIFSCNYDVITI